MRSAADRSLLHCWPSIIELIIVSLTIKLQMSTGTGNLFFQRNTIPAHPTTATPKIAKVRAKRAASVATLKHNPQTWQHRQVFDTGLYKKINFFNAGLEELRSGRERGKAERDLEAIWGDLGRVMGERGLGQAAVNYANHWRLLQQATQREDVRQAITKLVVEISQKAISFIHRMQHQHQQQVQQLQTQLHAFSKIQATQQIQASTLHPVANTGAIKKLQHQNKQLDFALKKEMLKVQNLRSQIDQQQETIYKLKAQNEEMVRERQEQSQFRETMNYRVRQLKEELMVAQVLKEQSMEEKMKYIMHW